MISAQNAVPEPMAEALLTEVLAVLALPQLAPLFGPDALAEASITGLVGSTGVAGQIDRMYVGDDQIVIADFKTGAMPDTPPPAYQRQLALYAALVEQLYGDRPIVCFLIWTERAAIQEVTPAMRTAALNKILID
jgi:ATP-dependent helicase/nuclease subunit A